MDTAVIKMITMLALVGALIAGYFGWHHHVDKGGYDRAEKLYQGREKDAKIAADGVLQVANEKVRVTQANLQEARETIITKNGELENAKINYLKLRTDYVLGVKRLSIASASCPRSSAEQDSSAASAGGSNETRTDLLPEDAASILDAARGSAEDVRELNICVDLYNAAREAVNSQ